VKKEEEKTSLSMFFFFGRDGHGVLQVAQGYYALIEKGTRAAADIPKIDASKKFRRDQSRNSTSRSSYPAEGAVMNDALHDPMTHSDASQAGYATGRTVPPNCVLLYY
jgi:hypothetical protein